MKVPHEPRIFQTKSRIDIDKFKIPTYTLPVNSIVFSGGTVTTYCADMFGVAN